MVKEKVKVLKDLSMAVNESFLSCLANRRLNFKEIGNAKKQRRKEGFIAH